MMCRQRWYRNRGVMRYSPACMPVVIARGSYKEITLFFLKVKRWQLTTRCCTEYNGQVSY